MLGQFNQQLWLAIRGVAGHLPLEMEKPKADDWETKMAAEARAFRKR